MGRTPWRESSRRSRVWLRRARPARSRSDSLSRRWRASWTGSASLLFRRLCLLPALTSWPPSSSSSIDDAADEPREWMGFVESCCGDDDAARSTSWVREISWWRDRRPEARAACTWRSSHRERQSRREDACSMAWGIVASLRRFSLFVARSRSASRTRARATISCLAAKRFDLWVASSSTASFMESARFLEDFSSSSRCSIVDEYFFSSSTLKVSVFCFSSAFCFSASATRSSAAAAALSASAAWIFHPSISPSAFSARLFNSEISVSKRAFSTSRLST
mmetsp:Transcript_37135/g.119103  ORF Transcript_37135/g.119103 Transcript_37135/m.119103 type:complete len:279 (+) Transcript_37135:824-1660(+)